MTRQSTKAALGRLCLFLSSSELFAIRTVVAAAVACATLALVAPNHSPPWMSFTQESLAAAALALLAVRVLLFARHPGEWRTPELTVLGLMATLIAQYGASLISPLQAAWMPALYLLGVVLAMQTGAALERQMPGAAFAVVLLPALIAGLISFGLQCVQWFALAPGESTIWVYRAVPGRPAANLGQPNHLATVHLLALVALMGMWRSRRWPGAVALVLAVPLMLGLAMTQSRTGLVGFWLVAGALMLWNWRESAPLRLVLPVLVAVAPVLYAGVAWLGEALETAPAGALVGERLSAGLRPAAWRLFAQALLERPLAGYGWGQTFAAQLAAAPDLPALHRVFLSAHNLPLELSLWVGLPLAALAVGALALWSVAAVRRARDDTSRLLLLALLVLATHAMVEHPLAYAYFLLPAGLAVGAIGQRLQLRVVWRTPAWTAPLLLVVASVAAGLTIRDYARVEAAYQLLLLEKARIQVKGDRSPPSVLVLDSLRDLIAFSRLTPARGMSDAELQWMVRVASAHPSAHGFARLALALVLNGHPMDAQHWVGQLCRVFRPGQCQAQAEEWASIARDHPEAAVVRWP